MLTLNSQSQDTIDFVIPLIDDTVALEAVENLYLWMEVVGPGSDSVELVEPSLAIVSIIDNSKLLMMNIVYGNVILSSGVLQHL